MKAVTRVALALSLGWLLGTVPGAGAEPIYTVEPPAEIAGFLKTLRTGQGDRVRAIVAMAARDEAAPYLRLELRAATQKAHKVDLTEALEIIEARAFERNKKRLAWWATTRRFDLCAEVIVSCPTDKEAVALADVTVRAVREVGAEAARRLGIPFDSPIGLSLPYPLKQTLAHTQLSGDTVSVSRRFMPDGHTLLRADICNLQVFEMGRCFAAVRSGVRHLPDDGHTELLYRWLFSTALVNNSLGIRSSDSALILCDGDLELEGIQHSNSVVIANGDIRVAKGASGDGGRKCLWCAAGNIALPNAGGPSLSDRSQFHAGGTVTFDRKPDKLEGVLEKQKALPFGVRFLAPQDFGLTLATQNGGVQVLAITADSPFAKQGVADGDVILQIDDVTADSIPAFRRQLRRGVVAESVVLRIRRGNERLTRIVFLDGLPLPTAPPPREKK